MARNEIKIRLSTTGKGKTEREIKGVNKSITNLAKSALTLAAAYKGVTFALESVKLAGQLKDLETAHNALTKAQGLNAKAMIDQMQKATRGTVSELELLKQANNALLLGLPVTEKDMGRLADAGRRLGRAMGIDAAMGLESLVVGIGRQSKLWLDNLGILVDTDRAYRVHAKSIGKQASALSDAEKKLAFYNETMKSVSEKMKTLGKDQDTVTDSFARAAVAYEKVKIALGEIIAEPLADTMEGAAKVFSDATSKTVKLTTEISQLEAQLKRASGEAGDSKERLGGFFGTIDNGIQALSRFTGIGQVSSEQLEQWRSRIAEAKIELEALKQTTDTIIAPAMVDTQVLDVVNQELIVNKQIVAQKIKQIKQEKILFQARKLVSSEIKQSKALFLDISNIQIENIQAAGRYAQQLARGVQLFQGMDRFAKSVLVSLQRMAEQLAQRVFAGLLGGVFGFVASGGNPLGFAAGFKSAGNFQEGGRPPVGRVSIVGERGPEPFIPDRPGTILPTEALGGNTLNVYVQGAKHFKCLCPRCFCRRY
jgi:hypothetical protein